MTAFFVKLDETDSNGTPLGEVLVNADAIIRITAEGPNHCAVLTLSFTTGPEMPAHQSHRTTSSRFFVAGTLRDLQQRLNCAVG